MTFTLGVDVSLLFFILKNATAPQACVQQDIYSFGNPVIS
jgi:hypothetical protein